MNIQNINDWFDSEEGQKAVADFANQRIKEKEIKNRQLERINNLHNFEQFTEKVIEKYNSDKYRDRYYNRGIEPPKFLFWVLFNYAQKYGRKCNKNEWKQYGNLFSSDLFFCNGFYFNRMDGQGSIIQITKKTTLN